MADIEFMPPSSFRELSYRINKTHEDYLRADESTEKIKYQNILESNIREFLSVEYHKNKFHYPKTADVLRLNAQSDSFNPLKASKAFCALSAYANNLYNQPWRKEYYEIKLYSGYYKHNIECCLNNAEAILELMGYRHTGREMVLEKPPDVEQLFKTSLDALTAMCECQIIFNIYEEVSRHIPICTWIDILKYREMYRGSTAEAVNGILSFYNYPKSCGVDCCGCSELVYLQPNNFQSVFKAQSCVPVNGYYMNYRPNFRYYPEQRLHFTNGQYRHVPTGNLIDIEDPLEYSREFSFRKSGIDCYAQAENSRFVNRFPSDNVTSFEEKDAYKRDRIREVLPKKSNRSNSNFSKTWEFVYKELENGSKVKHSDSGLLDSSASSSKMNGICLPLVNLTLDSASETRASEVENDMDSHKRVSTVKPNSLYLNRQNVGSRSKSEEINKEGTLETWSCPACTFRNEMSKDVCEICSRSKNINEDEPLISGGKHCNRCTLVNKKEATRCEACDDNLENSPTYV